MLQETIKNDWHRRALYEAKENEFSPTQLDKLIANSKSKLKDDRTTTVVHIENDSDSWVLKRYNAKGILHRFTRAVRRTRAIRCWRMSEVYTRCGLFVPERKFMLEKHFFGLNADAYFAYRFIAGQELLQYLPKASSSEQEKISQAILHAFTVFEKHRLSHGDMKASNLLWAEQKLYFVDLDAAEQHTDLTSWRKANGKDRARFLKNWQNYPEVLAHFNQLS